jgi:hypothetical protein
MIALIKSRLADKYGTLAEFKPTHPLEFPVKWGAYFSVSSTDAANTLRKNEATRVRAEMI